MNYTVLLESRAERDLDQLPRDMLARIDAKLTSLARNPRPRGASKLAGKAGGGWRVRAGDYRILYTIDDASETVSVYRVRPRSDVYRR